MHYTEHKACSIITVWNILFVKRTRSAQKCFAHLIEISPLIDFTVHPLIKQSKGETDPSCRAVRFGRQK